MEKFKDPKNSENYNKYFQELLLIKNEEDTLKYCNEYFNGWILYTMDKYSEDYKFLDDNWNFVLNKINPRPNKQKIVKASFVIRRSPFPPTK